MIIQAKQDRHHYNPADFIPDGTKLEVVRKLFKQHFLYAVIVVFDERYHILWSPDFEVVSN